MAGPNRNAIPDVIERIREKPYRFSLYQVMRLMDCQDPSKPLIGTAVQIKDEPLRFGQEASLRFAPTELERYEPGTRHRPPKLVLNSIGLLGPHGPMPMHITQYVRDRIFNDKDRTLSAFLDIFHHRIVALFYRAWALNQQAVSYDRPESDPFARYVASVFGMGMDSFRNRDSVQDEAKLYYAGHLMGHARHASGLCALLHGYFQLPVEVDEFVGAWISIPPRSQSRLGESMETGRLGMSTVTGSRFWSMDQKFRIRFGPMKIGEYLRMLPSRDSFRRLRDWVTAYTSNTLIWDVEFVLEDTTIPAMQLGAAGCLGWSSWLISQPKDQAVVVVSGTS